MQQAHTTQDDTTQHITGAQMILRAMVENGVDTIFGYPGGAVLPIYDAIFQQNAVRHILVRHEQGATHAAVNGLHLHILTRQYAP